MGFWIFMLIMNLLIPIVMVVFGSRYAKKPINKINYISGYRTRMSMKNNDTWVFAHKYIGKLWRIIGVIMFIPAIVVMIFLLGKEIEVIGIFGLIPTGIQLIFMIIPIFFTEKALSANFDKEGNRR